MGLWAIYLRTPGADLVANDPLWMLPGPVSVPPDVALSTCPRSVPSETNLGPTHSLWPSGYPRCDVDFHGSEQGQDVPQ
jgi:hypothetical protein